MPPTPSRCWRRAAWPTVAYTWEPGSPFPTLRQMIEARKNVLIMAEHGGGAERRGTTRPMAPAGCCRRREFSFDSIEAMSCAPNRSGTAGPLFLLNHWVSTSPPSPLMAARANARSTLLRRAEECAEARGKRPNIILVDFHDRGDLFKVVDALNEVRGDTGPFQAAPEPPATLDLATVSPSWVTPWCRPARRRRRGRASSGVTTSSAGRRATSRRCPVRSTAPPGSASAPLR